MKTKFSLLSFSAVALFAAVGCSSSPDQVTPQQKQAFQGGPPPANYMDAANAATQAARSKTDAAPKAP